MILVGNYIPYQFIGFGHCADSFKSQYPKHKDSLNMDLTRKAYKVFRCSNGKSYVTMDTMMPV